MSLHPVNVPEMNCADFEKSFDAYVDDMLDPTLAAAARGHASACPPCNREVTRWQQTRILLSTAVADFASAVDVSSLHRDVEAALGFAPGEAAVQRRRGGWREAALERRGGNVRRGRDAARTAATGRRQTSFQALARFASAAVVSAAAAAVAVMVLSPSPQSSGSQVASAPRSTFQQAGFRPGSLSSDLGRDVAPVAYTPPPLARPEVSHVDGLEAAPGHLVSTWVQPRTNARVIWVQDRGLGAPIRTAGLDR